MAYYRRKTRSSGGRRSSYARPTRRAYSRRRASPARGARRAQVVRIVLEQHPANAVGRPIMANGSLVRPATIRKAAF